MPSCANLSISLERLTEQMTRNIRARVFEKWGVSLDDVAVQSVADAAAVNIATDTELIPGMLWAGYSERLNTLVLRTV